MAITVFNPQIYGGKQTSYIYATPTEFTLSKDSWNGTTYKLGISDYTVVSTPQIGLPPISDYVNTGAVVRAALTIPESSSSSITISAVNAPTRDIKIAIFGLEKIAETVSEEASE